MRNNEMMRLLAALVLLTAGGVAHGATYCVDKANGSNSNDGQESGTGCWKDATYADGQTFSSGDVVQFYPGAYVNLEITAAGTTWELAPDQAECSALFYTTALDGSSSPEGILLVDATDVTIRGLCLDPALRGSGKSGVHVEASAHRAKIDSVDYVGASETPLELYRMAIQDTGRDGTSLKDALFSIGGDDVELANSFARYWPWDIIRETDAGMVRMYIHGNDVAYSGNDVYDMTSGGEFCLSPNLGDPFYTVNGRVIGNRFGPSATGHGAEHNQPWGEPVNTMCRGGMLFEGNVFWGSGESNLAIKGLMAAVFKGNVHLAASGDSDGNHNGINDSCQHEGIDGSDAQSRDTLWMNNVMADNAGGIAPKNGAAYINNTLLLNSRDMANGGGGTICTNESGLGGGYGGPSVMVNNVVFNKAPQLSVWINSSADAQPRGNVFNTNGKFEVKNTGTEYTTLQSWLSGTGYSQTNTGVNGTDDLFVDQSMDSFTLGTSIYPDTFHLTWDDDIAPALTRLDLWPAYGAGGEAVGTIKSKTSSTVFDLGHDVQAVGFCWETIPEIPRPVIRVRGDDYTVASCDYNTQEITLATSCSACVAGDSFDLVYENDRTSRQRGAWDFAQLQSAPPPIPPQPSTHCVDLSGSDGATGEYDGTLPGTCWATFQHAADNALPGNQICFGAGDHGGANLAVDGTLADPITWTRCPGVAQGAARLYRASVDDSSDRTALVYGTGDYHVIHGLDIAPGLATSGKHGIYIKARNAKGWRVEDVRFFGDFSTGAEKYTITRSSYPDGTNTGDGSNLRTALFRMSGTDHVFRNLYGRHWPFQFFGEADNNTTKRNLVEWNDFAYNWSHVFSIGSQCQNDDDTDPSSGYPVWTGNTYRFNKGGHSWSSDFWQINGDPDHPHGTLPSGHPRPCKGGYVIERNLCYANAEDCVDRKGMAPSLIQGNVAISHASDNDGPTTEADEYCGAAFMIGSEESTEANILRLNAVYDGPGLVHTAEGGDHVYNNIGIRNTRHARPPPYGTCLSKKTFGGVTSNWGGYMTVINNIFLDADQAVNANDPPKASSSYKQRWGGNLWSPRFSKYNWKNKSEHDNLAGFQAYLQTRDDMDLACVGCQDDVQFQDVILDATMLNDPGPPYGPYSDPLAAVTYEIVEPYVHRIQQNSNFIDTGVALATVKSSSSGTSVDVGGQWDAFCCQWDLGPTGIGAPMDRVLINGEVYQIQSLDGGSNSIVLDRAVTVSPGDEVDVVYPSGRTSRQQGTYEAWDLGNGTTPPEPPDSGTVSVQIETSNDDGEEWRGNGTVDLDSNDLELTYDPQRAWHQVVATRFPNVGLSPGVNIISAHVQFTVDKVSPATDVEIYGELVADSAVLQEVAFNISDRLTGAAGVVNWSVPAWPSVGAAGDDQKTPGLAAIIQEIVNQPGWAAGNAITLLFIGDNSTQAAAIAESFDGLPSGAPTLVINYGLENQPPTLGLIGPRDAVEQQEMAIVLQAQDPDGIPILSADESGLPSDPDTALVGNVWTWTPAAGDSAGSPYTVTFRATDEGDPSVYVEENVAITVAASPGANLPPVLSPTGQRVGTEQLPLAIGFLATDDSGLAPIFTADLSTLPVSTPTPSFTDNGNGTADMQWTPPLGSAPGPYSVQVTATDPVDSSLSSSEVFLITVQTQTAETGGVIQSLSIQVAQ